MAGSQQAFLLVSVHGGLPESIKVTFNSTLVGFERLMTLQSDIVLGVNEKMISSNKNLFETFIYMLNER